MRSGRHRVQAAALGGHDAHETEERLEREADPGRSTRHERQVARAVVHPDED